MKELKTITEYQLLKLAYYSLLERIVHMEDVNKRAREEHGRDNCACQALLKKYNEQLEEVMERLHEIKHNNAE